MKFYDYEDMYQVFKSSQMDMARGSGEYRALAKTKAYFKNLSVGDIYGTLQKMHLDRFKEVQQSQGVEWDVDHPVRESLRYNAELLHMECEWFSIGCPYYKIWPGMSDRLSDVRLDVPVECLHLPYEQFSIMLPDGGGLSHLTDDAGRVLTSMMVGYAPVLEHTPGAGREVLLTYQTTILEGDWEGIRAGRDDSGVERCVTKNTFYVRMGVDREHMTLQQAVDRATSFEFGQVEDRTFADARLQAAQAKPMIVPAKSPQSLPDRDFIRKVVHIAISTCFFGVNNHEIILPDMPRKKKTIYHRHRAAGDDAAADAVLAEQRENAVQWCVGSEIALPTPAVDHKYIDGERPATGGLSTSHVRSGHMRIQPMGPRDNRRYEMIFIAPTVVRPDLPMGSAHGYRLPDTNLIKRKVNK